MNECKEKKDLDIADSLDCVELIFEGMEKELAEEYIPQKSQERLLEDAEQGIKAIKQIRTVTGRLEELRQGMGI